MPEASQSTSDFKGDHLSVNMFRGAGADIGAWINAAVAALPKYTTANGPAPCGEILIPTGDYSFSTPIVINSPLVIIQGQGSVLRYTGTGTAMEFSDAPTSYSGWGGLKDVKLFGTAAAAVGIELNEVTFFKMHNVRVSGFSSGIGIYLHDTAKWTERLEMLGVQIDECATGIKLADNSGGSPGQNGFAYHYWYNLLVSVPAGGTGIWISGISYLHGHFVVSFFLDQNAKAIHLTDTAFCTNATWSITGELTGTATDAFGVVTEAGTTWSVKERRWWFKPGIVDTFAPGTQEGIIHWNWYTSAKVMESVWGYKVGAGDGSDKWAEFNLLGPLTSGDHPVFYFPRIGGNVAIDTHQNNFVGVQQFSNEIELAPTHAVAWNAYWDSGAGVWKYRANGTAARIQEYLGTLKLYTAPSGLAGDPVTFTEVTGSPDAPNVLSSGTTVAVVYQPYGHDWTIAFNITVALPTTHPNYPHLKEIDIRCRQLNDLVTEPLFPHDWSGPTITFLTKSYPLVAGTYDFEFDCINDDGTVSASPVVKSVVVNAPTLSPTQTAADVPGSRYKYTGGVRTVLSSAPAVNNGQYPLTLTAWRNEGSGQKWCGWFTQASAGATVLIGAEGSPTEGDIIPPTAADGSWTLTWAIGAIDSTAAIPAGAITTSAFTVTKVAAPGATDGSGAYIDSVTYALGPGGASMFGVPHAYLTLPSGWATGATFMFARLELQTGTGTGGAFTPGGVHATPMNVGDWLSDDDHAAGFYRVAGTDTIYCAIPNVWNVPSDGNNTHRFKWIIASRRDDGSGATKVYQNCWSSAVGVSTPGTNPYQDLVVDGTKSKIANINIPTAAGTVQIINGASDGMANVGEYSKIAVRNDKITALSLTSAWDINLDGSAQFNSKYAWDVNGLQTLYDGATLAGKGLAHIIHSSKFSSQTGPLTFEPLDSDGAHVSGFLRLNIAIEISDVTGTPSGRVVVLAYRTRNIGAVVTWNTISFMSETAGTFGPYGGGIAMDATGFSLISASSQPFVTDGQYSASGSLTGLKIDISVPTPLVNCKYNLYLAVEKLADL